VLLLTVAVFLPARRPSLLPPNVPKLLLKRASHVRGELKTKMCLLTGSFYGFRASNSMEVIRTNRDLAESLKVVRSLFSRYADPLSKSGIYKTELLQEGINLMWFVNRGDEGVIYHKYFDPMPVRTIALMLMAVSRVSYSYFQLDGADNIL
ncbi:hypothetical protein EV702DRAFT_958445, partial [Suillus placidus]